MQASLRAIHRLHCGFSPAHLTLRLRQASHEKALFFFFLTSDVPFVIVFVCVQICHQSQVAAGFDTFLVPTRHDDYSSASKYDDFGV